MSTYYLIKNVNVDQNHLHSFPMLIYFCNDEICDVSNYWYVKYWKQLLTVLYLTYEWVEYGPKRVVVFYLLSIPFIGSLKHLLQQHRPSLLLIEPFNSFLSTSIVFILQFNKLDALWNWALFHTLAKITYFNQTRHRGYIILSVSCIFSFSRRKKYGKHSSKQMIELICPITYQKNCRSQISKRSFYHERSISTYKSGMLCLKNLTGFQNKMPLSPYSLFNSRFGVIHPTTQVLKWRYER